MTRDSDADQATLKAVFEAAQSGAHRQAAGLAEAALASGLVHPLLLNVVALELEQQARVVEAERVLRRAVQIAPNDVGSRNALGLNLLRLERPAAALAEFDALIRIDPVLPFAHVNRGNALLALGDVPGAEACYRHALGIDPQQGVALARLAHIYTSRGAYPEAQSLASRALALLPGYPDAVLSLAAAELGTRELAAAEARIRALLQDTRLTAKELAHANGLLGDILDAANQPPQAFAAYMECNQALQREYADRYGPGDNALEYVEAMTRYFGRTQSESWKSAPPLAADACGARGHVFLLGFPRSGTTLLEVILEGHPDAVSLEEKELLLDGVQAFMQRPADLDGLLRATPHALESLRAAYWRRVAENGASVAGKIFVDKYPLNTLKLPLIARLFPNAKILFACRDPRDIVLSCFRHRFRMSAPLYEVLSIEGAARYYSAVMALVVRLTSVMALEMCLIRHEDLVTEFAREMKRICAYLNLEWAPAMGDFALRAKSRAVLTPSTAQLVRGLNTEGLGHWHRYRAYLEPVLPLLETWVKRFYYEA